MRLFKRKTPERVIRLEILLDALLSLLVGKNVVTHSEIQKQILKNSLRKEPDDDVRES